MKYVFIIHPPDSLTQKPVGIGPGMYFTGLLICLGIIGLIYLINQHNQRNQ